MENCGAIVRGVIFRGKDGSQRWVKWKRPPFAADYGGMEVQVDQKAKRIAVEHERLGVRSKATMSSLFE